MKPKYQIFVSSTYEDLKSERDVVIKAILEMGNIPVGMEMFSAGDEQQWELIKRQIDDSDYYVVIIAHRYGSTDGTVSYTEKEYDYATANHIPVLGFIIEDDARWSKAKMDTDPIAQRALGTFKEKVKRKLVSFWKEPEDLHAKVAISLSRAATAYPRPGWVRATLNSITFDPIKITHPGPGKFLTDGQPMGSGGQRFPVRGTLKSKPRGHEVWILVHDGATEKVRPQFRAAMFDADQGTWSGWINPSGQSEVRIVAVVAPPTSHEFFQYFQKVGDLHHNHVPLERIPPECTNRDSVQAWVPKP
jgi:hypothetical protein